MDKLFIWLTIGIGGLALLAIMYLLISLLYQRLKNFVLKWMYEHPNVVTEIHIKLDDLSCAIQNGVERFKLNLIGETRTSGSITIETDEIIGRREMEALYKRETEKKRMAFVATY